MKNKTLPGIIRDEIKQAISRNTQATPTAYPMAMQQIASTAVPTPPQQNVGTRPDTEKVTLVDADEITGNDSAASFSQIRTTWANIKTFLAGLFVPNTRTVNGHALTSNVTVTAGDLGAFTLDQTTPQTIINGIPILSGAGNVYLEIKSTDHLIAGLKLSRADYGTDIYADMVAYNQTSHYKIDQIVSSATTNLMDLTNALALFPGNVQATGYGANGAFIRGMGAGGTLASPAATAANQYILQLCGNGYTTAFLSGAQGAFCIRAAELFTATNQGTYATIELTPIGSTTRATVATFLGNGNVGIGTVAPNANAILDLTSTTKAFMPPRMTNTQMNAISSPTEGMVAYDLTNHKLCFHNGTSWIATT